MTKESKNKIVLAGFVMAVVIGVLWWQQYLKSQKQGNQFINVDSAAITKIQIVNLEDSAHSKIYLEKSNQGWKLNSRFTAEPKLLALFLNIYSSLEIQMPVPNSISDSINKLLTNKGLLIRFFSQEKLCSQVIIGDRNSEKNGNYAKIPLQNDLYIIANPGFSYSLLDITSSEVRFWRNKTLIEINPNLIQSASLIYKENPEKSFQIQLGNPQTVKLFNAQNKAVEKFNSEKILTYCSYFSKIEFESIISKPNKIIDSLANATYYFDLKLTLTNEQKMEMKAYRIVDKHNKSGFDVNRFFIKLANEENIYVMKYYDFDPVLKEIDYFY